VLPEGLFSGMTNLIKSRHARVRQQQRHITDSALELLMNYGIKKRQRRGCAIIYLSKKGKQLAIKKDIKPNICGIVDLTDNVLITVQYRYKRIKNY
jgi:hypothetical protein